MVQIRQETTRNKPETTVNTMEDKEVYPGRVLLLRGSLKDAVVQFVLFFARFPHRTVDDSLSTNRDAFRSPTRRRHCCERGKRFGVVIPVVQRRDICRCAAPQEVEEEEEEEEEKEEEEEEEKEEEEEACMLSHTVSQLPLWPLPGCARLGGARGLPDYNAAAVFLPNPSQDQLHGNRRVRGNTLEHRLQSFP
ncbi:unnamed protein product [Arctogadus glacialis]